MAEMGNSSTMGSKSANVSLAAEMAYRSVKEADLPNDGDVPDKQKLKAVRFGSLSFGFREVVTSTIKFDTVK